MLKKLSFRGRLLLSFWGVLFLALLLPSLYYRNTLSKDIEADTESQAIRQLSLLAFVSGAAFQEHRIIAGMVQSPW